MSVWEIAIVGAGPAGVAAAVEAARLGARPLLMDASGRAGGTIRIAHEVRDVPFLPDCETGASVAEGLEAFLSRWKLSVEEERVVGISCEDGELVLETDAGEHRAERAILATGTEPRLPEIPGLAGSERVAGSASEAWLRHKPRRAVVVGGSDVALDQARWLRARGVEVEVLARGRFRAPAWLMEAAVREGVGLRRDARVIGGHWDVGDAAGCELTIRHKDAESVERVSAVVAAIGRRAVRVEGARAAMDGQPGRLRVVGDGTGRRARHVVAALGDGCVAAAELLARSAGGSE